VDRPGDSEAFVTVGGMSRVDTMVERRLAGEPLQYVLGSWSFRTLDLMVDRRVLIPRPETEAVVGYALDEFDRLADRSPEVRVADLGTGSGAIGLSIAAERVSAKVWCSDVSTDALAVTRANLAGLGRPAMRVTVVEGSWFDALPPELAGGLGVVVSNPPYVATGEALPSEVADWEPGSALTAGPLGTEYLEQIISAAPAWLMGGGALILELSPEQAVPMADHASSAGFVDVEVRPDLTGRPRALVARRP
jgi:release factor glutamine methyltransferase